MTPFSRNCLIAFRKSARQEGDLEIKATFWGEAFSLLEGAQYQRQPKNVAKVEGFILHRAYRRIEEGECLSLKGIIDFAVYIVNP